MLSNNFGETVKVINKRILMKDSEPEKKREYFEVLVQNMDSTMREVYANVLV